MLVSLKEIGKYVDLSGLSAEKIADKLTSSGIEVEEIKHSASATNLIIGKIIKCDAHPSSDHLHVCKVDIGTDILQIVCGAPNAREGIKVIVALDGAELPEKTIKNSEIRGVISYGMLCALNELGVDPKYLREEQIKGIEELPNDAPIGNTKVLEYLGLDDSILDLKLLANRSDCYALYNVAKEIAALFNRKVNIPNYKNENLVDNKYKVSSNSLNCKQFGLRIFCNVKTKESPKWLKDVLRNEGIRSIDNIVDIGNYVMLLTGQPINMYDADKLPKKELIVNDDYEGDVLALDDKKYKIKKGDLVVSSDNIPMCIAGIMTLKNCEVTKDTKNIAVEVANFYGPQIRRTAVRIGLSSDSSQRFVKGINPNQVEEVMNICAYFIRELGECDTSSKTCNYDVINHDKKEISCSVEYINKRLGTCFSEKEIIDSLAKLYFKIEKKDSNNFVAVVPDSRIDIDGKADLSEEVLRYIGFDTIESKLPLMETTVGGKSMCMEKEDAIAYYLQNNGLYRVINYTLLNDADSKCFNLLNKNNAQYVVINPITEDRKIVRSNLLESMVRCAEYNSNHQNKDFGIFEISKVQDTKSLEHHLAILLYGNHYRQDKMGCEAYNFYDMKGYFEEILRLFNINETRVKYNRIKDSKVLHPTRSCEVTMGGKVLAVFGEIYPSLKDKYNFKKDAVVMLEMNLLLLFDAKSSNNKFIIPNKFPAVVRDYAFIIDENTEYAFIKNEIRRSSPLIIDVNVFDIYKGEHLDLNKKSVAIKVYIESKEHTLTDLEISTVDSKVRDALKKINANIRS